MNAREQAQTCLETLGAMEGVERFQCILWRYNIGHGDLLIRINDHARERRFYLYFSMTLAIAAPQRWQGANFQLGLPDESKQFFQTLSHDKLLFQANSPRALLFSLSNDNAIVKIIAASISIIPEDRFSYEYNDILRDENT
jgi:hypothetical protein